MDESNFSKITFFSNKNYILTYAKYNCKSFALLVAILAGTIITFSVSVLNHSILPPTLRIDTDDFEYINGNYNLFEFKYVLFSLIAHKDIQKISII